MRLYFNSDGIVACRVILQEQLERFNIKYKLLDFGEVEIKEVISKETLTELQASLNHYGITLIDNQKKPIDPENQGCDYRNGIRKRQTSRYYDFGLSGGQAEFELWLSVEYFFRIYFYLD